MKVLLIYPEFPDTFWSFKYALKLIKKRAIYPPLGLLTVAAMLPKDWGKRLVDLNVTSLGENDLSWADCAFISGINVQRISARQVIKRCKKAGIKIVAGGPLFTYEHQDFPEVDHFVLNEAELTLPPFMADLNNGQAKRLYQTPDFADIRKTPNPLWDLIDFENYAGIGLQSSRGCPFRCDFCNVTALFGHRPRTKTVEQIIFEMNCLYNLGWRGMVFFVDDNFIGNRRYLKTQLLPLLIEWRKDKKGISFNAEASLDIADDEELMKMMVQAGFDAVFIGIETPNDGSLVECNKEQNRNRDLIKSVKSIQRSGLQVQGGFIVGFDSDSKNIFERQIDFIQNSGIVTAMVALLQAPQGTRLYERLKREGRLVGQMSGDTDGSTNIIPKMGIDVLCEGYKYILSNIYSPKHYYHRIKNFLREFNSPKLVVPFNCKRFSTFFRVSIRLGILEKGRFRYWEILFWTLLRQPKFLPLAIMLAIYGYHFRKFSKSRLL